MKTSTHTIGDLISVYGDLLHYVRGDAEVHLASEHDDEDEMCPTKLYERGQAIYDDHKLFRLIKAAPHLLEACQRIVEAYAEGEGNGTIPDRHFTPVPLSRLQ